jgi:hypothetical protein
MDYNTTFSIVDRLSLQVMNKGHTVYMDGWLSSAKLFHHLWTYKKMSVDTAMPNRKMLPKHALKKQKVWEAITCQRQLPLTIKWKDTRYIHIFSTAHNNVIVAYWHPGAAPISKICSSYGLYKCRI